VSVPCFASWGACRGGVQEQTRRLLPPAGLGLYSGPELKLLPGNNKMLWISCDYLPGPGGERVFARGLPLVPVKN